MAWDMVSVDGSQGFKAIPCRFPPARHFQRIAPKRDWGLLDAIEAMTDDKARDEIGQIELVPPNERGGAHAAPVMSAFTRFDPAGSLFSDGSYGVLYLQLRQEAAISKGQQDATAFLAATRQESIKLQLGLYCIGLAGAVADLRQAGALSTTNCTGEARALRRLGKELRAAGVTGALYRDGSEPDMENLAIFRTNAVTECVRHAMVELSWDGKAIDSVSVLPAARIQARR